jgi:hypothetical protein
MPLSTINSNSFSSTANTNIDNGNLFIDAINNRIGVGTTGPAQKLDVNGSVKLSGLNAGSGLLFDLAGSADYQIKETSSDDVMQFGSNNTTGFRHNISSGNLQFNSGFGSIATAYACRAWINFDGTGTPAIRASGNISSITDNSTGNYYLNFTTAMPDGNYSAAGSVYDNAAVCFNSWETTRIGIYTRSIQTGGFPTGGVSDYPTVNAAFFR